MTYLVFNVVNTNISILHEPKCGMREIQGKLTGL